MSRFKVSNIIWDEQSRNRTFQLSNCFWFELADHDIRQAGNVEVALRTRLNSMTPGITALLFDYANVDTDVNQFWPDSNWLGDEGVQE